MKRTIAAAAVLAAALALAAFGSRQGAQDDMSADTAQLIANAIAAPDRPQGDLDRDARRRPAITLEMVGVQPGDRVLDLSAGGGYMSRLYSSVVGPEGHVTAENNPAFVDRVPAIAEAIDTLSAERGNVDHMLAAPDALDGEPGSYDIAVITLSYHDIMNGPTDRAAMNEGVYELLKPGGRYIVIDHMAEPGTGASATSTIHRVDKAYIAEEVTASGFTLASEHDGLHVESDPLNVSSRELPGGMSSQFALIFEKPAM
jgi:predicted methyltransferase